jgi:hypothetical protein
MIGPSCDTGSDPLVGKLSLGAGLFTGSAPALAWLFTVISRLLSTLNALDHGRPNASLVS